MNNVYQRPLLPLLICAALVAPVRLAAQQPDFRWEKALPAGSSVTAHNLNGDVTVIPSTTGRVEVIGVKHGNRRYFEAVSIEVVETARGITVCPVFRDVDSECDDGGFRIHSSRRYRDREFGDLSIDIEVRLPKGTPIDARSVSGNVSVVGAEGTVRARSVSGDVRMERLRASSVRAESVSGEVTVGVEALTGDGGGALIFTSVSGDVSAELPRDLNADVTMRSVSGSLESDFPLTLSGRMNRHSLEARIGRGGRTLEVRTVSGDVRLRAAK